MSTSLRRHGARHNGIPLSKDHTTFVELLRDAGYSTGLIGKSHLQSFTGLPATNKFEAREGLTTPSAHLRDAYKNNRHSTEYDLEVVPNWDRPLADRLKGDFYGFDHGRSRRSSGPCRWYIPTFSGCSPNYSRKRLWAESCREFELTWK